MTEPQTLEEKNAPTESIEASPRDSVEEEMNIELKECANAPNEMTPLGAESEKSAIGDQKKEPNDMDPPTGSSEADENDQGADSLEKTGWVKSAIGLFLLTFIIFVVVDSATNGYVKDGTTDFLEWVEENPGGGVIVFTVVIFFTTMLFIPGILLTFGSGYVFSNAFGLGAGVVLGSLSVIVGACSGAIASFLLGRFLLRSCVAKLIQRFKLLRAIDSAMEEKGLTIMLLLRLSPVIFVSPYLNYGCGGLSITFRDYCISLLAVFPSAAMFVFLGASTGSLSSGGDSTTTLIVTIVGIIFSIVAIGVTTYFARRELRKITSQQAEANEEEAQTDALNDTLVDIESGGEEADAAVTLAG